MIPCTALEAAGSSRALRVCRASISSAFPAPISRPSSVMMVSTTTSSPRLQVWDPSRGISFSSTPTTPPKVPASSNVYGARLLSHSAPTLVSQDNTVTAASASQSAPGDNQLPLPQGGDEVVTGSILDYPVLPAAWDSPSSENGDPQAAAATATPATAEEDKIEPVDETTPDPPYPALDYKMSEELFHAAKRAAPGTPESYWTYALYRGLDDAGLPQKPKVHYCRSKHTAEQICQKYFMDEKLLGFDLEWMADANRSSGVRRNVSLIQLASPSRILLYHVAVFPKNDFDLPLFKKIMENPEVIKVGVWIKGDATKIRTHLGVKSRGLVELSHLYKLVKYSRSGQFQNINKKLVPLATQVENVLHLPMFKGRDVRAGDWSRPLAMDQVIYSASDAYAGVHIYATLEHYRKQLNPCPPTPHYAELDLPIRLADGLESDSGSDDEMSELSPEEEANNTGDLSPTARKRQLKAFLKSVKENLSAVSKTVSKVEKTLTPTDPRVEAAEAWVAAFKAENQPADLETQRTAGFATAYELRAYHTWHTNKDLSPEDVAKLLRTPPLKAITVAKYIWCAVKKEKLPVDQVRYNNEVVELLPEKNKRFARRP